MTGANDHPNYVRGLSMFGIHRILVYMLVEVLMLSLVITVLYLLASN